MVRRPPELKRKNMYHTNHERMPIHFILHYVIGTTTWSVSCCRPAVLLLCSEPVALLYCRKQSHTTFLLTMNRCCIVYLHLIRSFVRSVELLNTNYARSGIGADRPILIPSKRSKAGGARPSRAIRQVQVYSSSSSKS